MWSKIHPSSANNYSPFEKQLLFCYWISIVTKCLTLSHQVTMLPELPIMNWYYPAHKAMKLGVYCNIPSSNGSGIYVIRPKQTRTIQVSYMKKWPKCPWSLLLLYSLSLSACTMASWGIPYNQLIGEEKTQVWFTDSSVQHADNT